MPPLITVLMGLLTGLVGVAGSSTTTLAADRVTFLTSWFAQAEHGGFYQAKAQVCTSRPVST